MEALINLSRTKGFYKVTMDELAAEAGLSKRTVYRYFRSKGEIVEAIIDGFCQRMGQEADHAAQKRNPEEIFEHILNNFFMIARTMINPLVLEDLRVHYPQFWRKIDEFRMGKAQMLIRAFLDEKNNAYARDINPRIVTTVVLAGIQAVLNPEFIINNGLTFEDAITGLLDFYKYGFLKKTDA